MQQPQRNPFLDFHVGRIIGTGLFALSLLFYRSYEQRSVFDRWSYPFFAIIIFAAILFLFTLIYTLRSRRKADRRSGARSGSFYLDLAILFWGIAYLISAVDDSINAARITQLNFFGSIVPAAICLEWIALVMLFIAAYRRIFSFLGKKWSNVLLMIGTVIVFLILGEAVIRFRAVVFPATQGYPTYTTALWGRRYVEYNRAGFRDVEHTLAAGPQKRRLLVVGDSYAFGWGIKSIEDRLGSRVCKELTARTQKQWEAINTSRRDTHTLDHIEFLEQGLAYNPDVVILLYVFNDIDYLYPVTPSMFTSVLNVNAILFKNFYLFQELYLRIDRIKLRYLKSDRDAQDPYADQELLADHFRDLSTFATTAAERGALVKIVPFDIRVLLQDSFRHRYSDFIESAKAAAIPVWSLESAFDGYEYIRLTVNNLDRHPNELGNNIAAEKIVEKLIVGLNLYYE